MFGLGIAIFYFLLEVEQFLPDYSIGSLCTINGVNIFFNALSALIGPLKICLFRYFCGCLNIHIPLNLKGKNSFHALHWVPGCHKWGPKICNALSALLGPLKICIFCYFRGHLKILTLNLKRKN